jgi:hypothetical protein
MSDFADGSNNFFTDIGPLLTLFGDPVTKQYLSESIFWLDYFIFAMAPLGVIAAMSSVIRLCGPPWLRSLIGMSREGVASVEAELCTSTSRDVCELFNQGGITRVLGKPKILELVQDTEKVDDEETAGLFLFQDYLRSHGENGDWHRSFPTKLLHRRSAKANAKDAELASTTSSSDDVKVRKGEWAPMPNLSLNVGVKRMSNWVYILFSVAGFIMQGGMLVLAGVGAWKLDWEVDGGDGPNDSLYAPIMFIGGTTFLCLGM